MRVFILCTGRCGSTTFIRACKHIRNFTAGHESRVRLFGKERFAYPENHIEADNRLSWHLGQLNKQFGNEPLYIHLKRDREKVAKSYLKRFYVRGGIIDSFCEGIVMMPGELLSEEQRLQACYDYVDTVTSNVNHFLSDKENVLDIDLENIRTGFVEFWERVGADGDLDKALEELEKKHNASAKRKLNFIYRIRLILTKEIGHLRMWLK